MLQAEGLDVSQHIPRHVTREELTTASRVISLGCDLDELAPPGTIIEYWNDVPLPGQNLLAARAAIYAHIERLVAAVCSNSAFPLAPAILPYLS